MRLKIWKFQKLMNLQWFEKNPVTVLCIHDLFGTELAMIFSFHVGLTDSVMQRMQFFLLSVSVRHFLATALPDLLDN
jgi:hypothetical protein